MPEKFEPSDPQYRKIEDLPEEHQAEFVDTEDGFIKKEIREDEEKLKLEVVERGLKNTTYLDLAQIEAYEIKRLRERNVEDIEQFDINQDGLVVHGTSEVGNLEGIIKKRPWVINKITWAIRS